MIYIPLEPCGLTQDESIVSEGGKPKRDFGDIDLIIHGVCLWTAEHSLKDSKEEAFQ